MSQSVAEHGLMASYARLARAAYNREKYSGDYEGQGYIIDNDLSDNYRTTFYHPQSKKAVVSFRGTKLTNLMDIATDIAIARGSENKTARFMNSMRLSKAAIEKYGKDNVALTGHSLGGTQAIKIGQKTGIPAYAFNPGIGPKTGVVQALTKLLTKHRNTNVNIFHTGTKDFVSILAPLMNGNVRRVAPRFQNNAHGIDNFIF